ncbi:MAG: CHAT domain-containing protein [Microcoleaceae cyanobacterium]
MLITPQHLQRIHPFLSVLLIILAQSSVNAQVVVPSNVVPAQDGTGTIVTPEGNQFNVDGGQRSGDGANLFHSFKRLGLSQDQILNFMSAPEIQNILGRVTGGEASFINGLIQITGGNSNLFLINPAGILFGQNASLNIPGSLTLTTANSIGFESINGVQYWQEGNWSELVGTPNRFVFDPQNPGSIANFGNLSLAAGSDLTILAGSVLNAGTLEAAAGQITVAALPEAGMIRISQAGNLLNLEVLPAPDLNLQQTGLDPLSLPDLLTGGQEIAATSVQVNDAGEIVLSSGETIADASGAAIVTDQIDAADDQASDPTEIATGGEINLTGNRVIVSNADLNANGLNRGGTIRIGGSATGETTLPVAQETIVNAGSQVQANAEATGDGGQIVFQSEQQTAIAGQVSAQGGASSGNSGSIETSSQGVVSISQAPNIAAPAGQGGTWLIHPQEIQIVDETDPLLPDGTSQLDAALVEDVLINGGNVILQAGRDLDTTGGNITFSASIDPETTGAGATLMANAVNDIQVIGQDIVVNPLTEATGFDLSLNADFDGNSSGNVEVVNATIDTNGGNATVTGNDLNLQSSQISTGIGEITFNGSGNLEISSATINTDSGNITIAGNDLNLRSSQVSTGIGNLSLVGDGAVRLDSVTADTGSGQFDASGSRIDITNATAISTESGAIDLTGNLINSAVDVDPAIPQTTAAGTSIRITGDSEISSVNGAINITGFTDSVINNTDGIFIQDSRIVSTGLGGISLDGTSGNAEFANGIFLGNSTIEANGSGQISLTGVSGAGENVDGIFINGTSSIQGNNGNLQLDGTTNGSTLSDGISLGNGSVIELAGDGSITLNGIAAGAGENNDGITLNQARIEVLGTGNITLEGFSGNGVNSDGISILNGSQLQALAGNIKLAGASNHGDSGHGISVENSTISLTSNGNILLEGLDRGTGISNGDILLRNGFTAEVQNEGNITIVGDQIDVLAGSSLLTETGSISLSGNQPITFSEATVTTSGGDIAANGDGIDILTGTIISTTSGTIDLAGIIPEAVEDEGINVIDNSQITSVNGNINLTGITNSSADNTDGIVIRNSRIESTGSGQIILSGTSNSGSFADGIFLTENSIIQTNDGNIEITGISNGTINQNRGISLVDSSVQSSGSGNISLNGTGGDGNNSDGIHLNNILVQSNAGNIDLMGAANGNTESQGILVTSGAVESEAISIRSTGNGNITLIGTASGTGENNDGITLNQTGIVTQGAGIIRLEGTSQGSSTSVSSNGVEISGSTLQSESQIELSGTVVGSVIDSNDGTPENPDELTVPDDGTSEDNVSDSNLLGESIVFANDSSIVLAENGLINFTGNRDVQLPSLNIPGGNVTAESTAGNIILPNEINVSSLDGSGGSVELNGDIQLTQPTTRLNTRGNSDGTIALNGSVNANFEGTTDLVLDAGSGTITLEAIGNTSSLNRLKAMGGDITGTGSITVGVAGVTIDSTGNVRLDNNINTSDLGGITIDSTGAIELNGNVDSAGAVLITADQQLSTANITANQIELTSTQADLIAGNLDTSSTDSEAGTIRLEATNGAVTAGDLNASGVTGSDITVIAEVEIQAGRLNSSGTTGDAGNILLDPAGDIEVRSIRAEGGDEGQGGNVEAESREGFFRVTDTFQTPFSPDAVSISTGGGSGDGGTIEIRHAGSSLDQPFEVGGLLPDGNGTVGVVTTGDSTIASTTLQQSVSQGNITIQDGETPAVPVTPDPTSTPILRDNSPEPAPDPDFEPSPEPAPDPDLAPSPEPVLDPEPAPTPEPEVSPEPAPEPDFEPSPDIVQDPEPILAPEPEVIPEPDPTPEITPEPNPNPELTPAPQPPETSETSEPENPSEDDVAPATDPVTAGVDNQSGSSDLNNSPDSTNVDGQVGPIETETNGSPIDTGSQSGAIDLGDSTDAVNTDGQSVPELDDSSTNSPNIDDQVSSVETETNGGAIDVGDQNGSTDLSDSANSTSADDQLTSDTSDATDLTNGDGQAAAIDTETPGESLDTSAQNGNSTDSTNGGGQAAAIDTDASGESFDTNAQGNSADLNDSTSPSGSVSADLGEQTDSSPTSISRKFGDNSDSQTNSAEVGGQADSANLGEQADSTNVERQGKFSNGSETSVDSADTGNQTESTELSDQSGSSDAESQGKFTDDAGDQAESVDIGDEVASADLGEQVESGSAEGQTESAQSEGQASANTGESNSAEGQTESTPSEGQASSGGEDTANSTGTFVPRILLSSNDRRAFQTNNVDTTVSLLEQGRNEEFDSYLGLKQTGIKDRRELQASLKSIEAQTDEVYVIVYVAVQDEQLELVLVPSSGLPIRHSVPEATPEKISAAMRELYLRVTNPRELTTTRYQVPAQQLNDWILKPLEPDLERLGATTLLFSMGPGLRSLPIATLWDGDRHLIEKYNYSLIPTSSLVDFRYTPFKEVDVLAMGASEFQEKEPLPAVPTEVRTINELWPGQSFLNESFTLNNLYNQRRTTEYDVIHLATHADFQPGAANNSYIQLWDDRLPIDQLETMNWNNPPVELLVLSACRTAVGDKGAELGFAGLAIKAGVKSAIASLWHVNDQSTLALMNELYNHLHSAPIKANALREAQLAMLQGKVRIESGQLQTQRGSVALPPELANVRSESFSHPYYWSGFAVIGAPW